MKEAEQGGKRDYTLPLLILVGAIVIRLNAVGLGTAMEGWGPRPAYLTIYAALWTATGLALLAIWLAVRIWWRGKGD